MSGVKRVGNAEKHGRRWRVAEIAGDGSRTHSYYASEAEARAYVEIFRSQQSQRRECTLGEAVTEYLDHLARFGGSKRRPIKGIDCVRSKLYGILQLTDARMRAANRGRRVPLDLPLIDRPIATLTPGAAQRLYTQRMAMGVSPDTHRSELVYANAFGLWALSKGYLKVSPFAEVFPEGELSAGKAQLRIDEARAFIARAYADDHPIGGIAAAGVLTLGVRASELLDRTARDLDDDCRVLWIPKAKTKAGRRRLAIPAYLRSRLLPLMAGLGPDDLVFSTMTTGTLLKHVHRLCEVAGVPKVCTHGLRGTQVTLTVEVAGMVEIASRQAGHAGTAVTRAHYMAAGTEESIRAERMEALLLADDEARGVEMELAEAERLAKEAAERADVLRRKRETLVLGTKADPTYPTRANAELSN